jgi:hypothetical protein
VIFWVLGTSDFLSTGRCGQIFNRTVIAKVSISGSTPQSLSVVPSILLFMDGGSVAVVGHPMVAALDAGTSA